MKEYNRELNIDMSFKK